MKTQKFKIHMQMQDTSGRTIGLWYLFLNITIGLVTVSRI